MESGWNGVGEGVVEISSPDENTLIYHENGHWNTPAGVRLKFTNVYRWSLEDEGTVIRLEHLRFGEDKPVYLFAMKQTKDGVWVSTEPHVCREDLYSAMMVPDSLSIELRWTIQRPKMDEDIRYWYTN